MKQIKQIVKVVKFIQTTIKLKKLWVDLGMSFKLPVPYKYIIYIYIIIKKWISLNEKFIVYIGI